MKFLPECRALSALFKLMHDTKKKGHGAREKGMAWVVLKEARGNTHDFWVIAHYHKIDVKSYADCNSYTL